MTAMPSAPPSTGSVPAPTSSSSTSAGIAQRAIHRRDVGDVPRERAQVRGDRLLVADVGEHRLEHRHAPSPASAGMCSPLCAISASSAAGLERHGLAAGVRAGDDQHARRRDQQHVDGDRLAVARRRGVPSSSSVRASDRRDQQRMPCAAQLEPAVGRRAPARWPGTGPAKRALAWMTSSVGGRVERPPHVERAGPERVGQRQQDAMDFRGFLLLAARPPRCSARRC